MAQRTVGIRDLKAQLSFYLRQVAAGETVIITDRGKPVGQITPIAEDVEQRLRRLVETGAVQWSGRRPTPVVPVSPNPGGTTVSELLLENRE
jgi:prevent-host-death family protein